MLKLSGCCLYTHSTVIDGVMSIIHSSFTLRAIHQNTSFFLFSPTHYCNTKIKKNSTGRVFILFLFCPPDQKI